MAIVIDASMTLSWHFADEDSAVGRRLLTRAIEEGVVVPAHWPAEVANGVLTGERGKRADLASAARLPMLIEQLRVELDREGGDAALSAVLPLARATGLTIYDALYLELAERRGLPLATFDGDLAKAARKAGVEVLQ